MTLTVSKLAISRTTITRRSLFAAMLESRQRLRGTRRPRYGRPRLFSYHDARCVGRFAKGGGSGEGEKDEKPTRRAIAAVACPCALQPPLLLLLLLLLVLLVVVVRMMVMVVVASL